MIEISAVTICEKWSKSHVYQFKIFNLAFST